MEAMNRKPFQGIANIIRFNWHFYALALAALVMLHILKQIASPAFHPVIGIAGLLLMASLFVSLAVSFYVYDVSGLYRLEWLQMTLPPNATIVNIHAGFDETSALLAAKFPQVTLTVFDFYDVEKHTEISISRARKAYPAYPGTRVISTANVPLAPASVDAVFCLLSAHEIRDFDERSLFFQQLNAALKPDGKIIVVEHLRDLPDFFAYNIGFFHFHSAKEWRRTFAAADLRIEKAHTVTPFITAYYLQKNGNAS